MVEKELKSLLTKKQYNQIHALFIWGEEFVQINHYYNDGDNFIRENDITVRVREKNGKHLLQVKKPMVKKLGLHIKEEHEEEIRFPCQEIDNVRLSDILGFAVEGVTLIGNLKTVRSVYQWDEHTQICLDENSYLDIVDYELEIEYVEDIDTKLLSVFSQKGILFDKETKGKYSRFCQRSIN